MKFWDHQHHARSETRRLLLGFALAVLVLVVAVHLALTLAWWLMVQVLPVRLPYPAGFMAANVGVSLLLVLGGWWVETSNLRAGGVRLARRVGARELRPAVSHAEQRLANVVDELCIAAHMPRPEVMVLPHVSAINAFAAGWDESDAVVAVTQGALDYLNREELQGMVAHELSHLHEGDTRLKMQLAGMVFGLELVYNLGRTMRERPGLSWWFGSAIMGAGLAGWLTGRMLKAAVSRQREYLADARAVQWTRSRDGLGGVLRKVMGERASAQRGASAPQPMGTGLHHASVQHMLLVDAEPPSRMQRWLDSHPTLQERVRRLYGRPMQALRVERVNVAPEPASQPMPAPGTSSTPGQAGGTPSLAAQLDPFSKYL